MNPASQVLKGKNTIRNIQLRDNASRFDYFYLTDKYSGIRLHFHNECAHLKSSLRDVTMK